MIIIAHSRDRISQVAAKPVFPSGTQCHRRVLGNPFNILMPEAHFGGIQLVGSGMEGVEAQARDDFVINSDLNEEDPMEQYLS